MAKGCFLHTYTKSMTPASQGEESVKIIISDQTGEVSQCTVFCSAVSSRFEQLVRHKRMPSNRVRTFLPQKLVVSALDLFLSRQQVFVGSLVD
jgi:hypothetical protein